MSDTLPKLLKQKYELYGDRRIALRVKHHGIWPAYTWQDFYHNVKQLSLGLISLGLEAGDKVAILGETKPEAYFTELATQAANCVVVGVFTDCSIEEVKYYLEHSDCRFAVVQDQEQVDKLLAIKDDLPLLKKVIYWDPKGLWNYDDPILMDFKEVQRLGREYEKEHPSLFEQKIENGKEDDLALHLYTSGTTGLPKAAMTTHKGLLNLVKTMSSLDNWQEGERYVAALSLAWIGEQLFGIGGTLVSGRIAHFPEKPELIQENYREIAPQVVFFGTRQWESLNRTVQAKIVDAHPLKRFFFRLFLPVGYKTGEVQSIKRFPLFWRALRFLAYLVVFRPLADKLGLLGIRLAYTAGASISPVTVDFFKAIGINIRQTYGSTEMSLITLHEMDDLNAESSGTPIRGTEVRISDEGEILVKGDMVYSGYYKDVEATREKHTDTGWYRSGDFGHITDEGHLIVMDRMDDLVALADGHRFSPQYIETRLRFSPYIKDAVVLGRDEPFVSVLIDMDQENVSRWAEAKHITYTTFADLSQKKDVLDLIRREISKINQVLPERIRIWRFVNLPKEFDPDEAEVTRTRKIRRAFVEERYADIKGAIYGNIDEFVFETPVTYQDGRKAIVKNVVKINPID